MVYFSGASSLAHSSVERSSQLLAAWKFLLQERKDVIRPVNLPAFDYVFPPPEGRSARAPFLLPDVQQSQRYDEPEGDDDEPLATPRRQVMSPRVVGLDGNDDLKRQTLMS